MGTTRAAAQSWPANGLDDEEAARRLAADGPNTLPAPPRPTLAQRVGRQLADPLTFVLVVVAVVTLGVLRQVPEGGAIAAIVLLNVAIGVGQERRAQAAVDELEDLTATERQLRRFSRRRQPPVPSRSPAPRPTTPIVATQPAFRDRRAYDDERC